MTLYVHYIAFPLVHHNFRPYPFTMDSLHFLLLHSCSRCLVCSLHRSLPLSFGVTYFLTVSSYSFPLPTSLLSPMSLPLPTSLFPSPALASHHLCPIISIQ